MKPLPVAAQPPGRESQRMAGRAAGPDPGRHRQAGADRHQMPAAVADPVRPADPAVPRRKRFRARVEQQAAGPAAMPVENEMADMLAVRLPVAGMVVAVDGRADRLPASGVRHRPGPHRPQLRQRGGDLRLRIGFRCHRRRPVPGAGPRLALRRQRQDAMRLQDPGIPMQAPVLQSPFAVLRFRCPRITLPGPFRLPSGRWATVSWTSAVRARAVRLPDRAVVLSAVIPGSMPASRSDSMPEYGFRGVRRHFVTEIFRNSFPGRNGRLNVVKMSRLEPAHNLMPLASRAAGGS